MATDACMVLTTAASDETVDRIIDRLLGSGLAACIQVLPMTSHYVWQGRRVAESEKLLLCKARGSDYPAIESAIRDLHDYDVPEILRIDVADGSASYLAWLMLATERGTERLR